MRDIAVPSLPDSCKPRVIKLPYKSRDPGRLAEVMEPAICDVGGLRFYVWGYCRELACRLCIVPGSEYKVIWERVSVSDKLSGLREHLRVPRGLVDDKLVWRAVWDGMLFRVDDITCNIIVKPNGTIVCGGNTLPLTRDYLLYCVDSITRDP